MTSSSLQRSTLLKSLPPKFSLPSAKPVVSGKKQLHRDFTPLQWTEFFDEKKTVEVGPDKFNVYLKGSSGPRILCIHGGGYSGLTWACLAEELSKRIECCIVAPDLRGHGESVTTNDSDLSAERQIQDIAGIYQNLNETSQDLPTFVIGHSMGGALAVHATSKGLIPNLIALAVIDVVEGSAMEALHGMRNFLRGRPSNFKSQTDAIQWCLKTGTVRNNRAARISMPAQIRPVTSSESTGAAGCLDEMSEERETVQSGQQESTNDNSGENSNVSPCTYEWRIDLMKSEPFWTGWFQGMSQLFLSVNAPKLLILAGVDRLDKDLTVGQMQGKFQMIVLPKVGHAVQEDSADKLADALTTFCVRNRFCSAKGHYQPVYPGC